MVEQHETALRERKPAQFEDWELVARMEADRFCDACGYNVREQPIRREPHTGVFMYRCPECGRFHAAATAGTQAERWWRRISVVLLLFWALLVLSTAATAGISQGMAAYLTLDEMTSYEPFGTPRGQVYRPVIRAAFFMPQNRHLLYELYGLSLGFSFGLGLVTTLLAVGFLPHWSKRRQVVVLLVWAFLSGAVVAAIWRSETVDLWTWGLKNIAGNAAAYVFGGILAVWFGHALLRWMLRTIVPPKYRGPFEAFWQGPAW